MSSLYDDLAEKLKRDPRLSKRGGARYDLGLLMFNAGDDVRELWMAAESEVAQAKCEDRRADRLEAAVDALRPVFGDRAPRQ